MNNRFLITMTLLTSSTLFMAGCSEDNSSFETPNTSGITTNPGAVSHKHLSFLASDAQPLVIDPLTGDFLKTDVTMTVYIADRHDHFLTDEHTILFRTEYGVIESSCVTEDSKCSVTWSAIKRPEAGGPGDDLRVTITAYTIGEEAFNDTNGDGVFDDNDGITFDDLEEPYVDANESGSYDIGEEIIDVVNGLDTTGKDGLHNIGDTLFNGSGCTHSSLCSTTVITNATIWDDITLKIDGPPVAP